jgi:hypothetical protein
MNCRFDTLDCLASLTKILVLLLDKCHLLMLGGDSNGRFFFVHVEGQEILFVAFGGVGLS